MPLPTYQHSECERQARQTAIQKRAYILWEQAGRPKGRDQEFWYTAEAEYNESEEIPAAYQQPVLRRQRRACKVD